MRSSRHQQAVNVHTRPFYVGSDVAYTPKTGIITHRVAGASKKCLKRTVGRLGVWLVLPASGQDNTQDRSAPNRTYH